MGDNIDFKISDDLKLVITFYNLTQKEFSIIAKVEWITLARTEANETAPRFEFLDKVYSYIYKKILNLNLQKEMFYKDDIKQGHILLVHSSKEGLIGDISLDK